MSKSHIGKITWMKGKHHTEEAKEKNRLAHLKKDVQEDKNKVLEQPQKKVGRPRKNV